MATTTGALPFLHDASKFALQDFIHHTEPTDIVHEMVDPGCISLDLPDYPSQGLAPVFWNQARR